jgi:hypothetical protein
MNIGASAREEYSVNCLEQVADVCDVRHARKHQWQGIGHFRDGPEVSFSHKLHCKPIVHKMRVPDHANHWSRHRQAPIWQADTRKTARWAFPHPRHSVDADHPRTPVAPSLDKALICIASASTQ